MSKQVINGTKAVDKINVDDEGYTINAGDGNNRVIAGDGDNSIQSGKGNDQITVGRGSNVITSTGGTNRIIGSDGNTQITTGKGKDDIRLGNGDNTIAAGDGANKVTAGNGSNVIETGTGADRITLGDGDNTVIAGAGNNQISVGDGINEIASGSGRDKITVGNLDNKINAGNGQNSIKAGGGDNLISTGKDKDTIVVGDGNNIIDAGDGDNRITAGVGNNDIRAGDGRDDIRVGDGNNQISAGDGSNRINAGNGDNIILSGKDKDTITVGNGVNAVSAGGGDNRVTVGGGDNAIITGAGRDDIRAGNGNNTITAGDGNNKVQVGNGVNQIETGSGADTIRAGKQSTNTINAGDGKNTITLGDGHNGITTGSGDDKISVGDGENVISAGDGRNNIKAGDGDNFVETKSGNDTIRLGDGKNEILTSGGSNKITLGDGNNEITTGGGNDNIKVGDGHNYIDAGAGKNGISAGKGENYIVTGSGDDRIRVGGSKNEINAGDGKNTISAGNGNTVVKTGAGNDSVKLGNGDNSIFDQGGNNKISVGDGNVFMALGDGRDDIRAGDGFVSITTGNGDKKVTAGEGFVEIYTEDGNDNISVGKGEVEIYAGEGNNKITVKGGADITVGDGNNSIRTGDGYTNIEAGNGANRISTGDGGSAVVTGSGRDDIRVGDDGSEIYAGAGNDKIRTGNGENEVHGGEGNDAIQTGKGDDKIWGGQGNDSIKSGDGYDIAYYAGSFSDYVVEISGSRVEISSINASVSDAGIDKLSGVEAIYFSGDSFLFDLTWEGDPTLVDDQISNSDETTVTISRSDLLANDKGLPENYPSFAVAEYSTSGIRVTYDGENITYNADDALQYLGLGEVFEDSFTYTVTDPYGNTFEANVNVSVTGGENEAPVAQDDLLIGNTSLQAEVVEHQEFMVNSITRGTQDKHSTAVFEDRSSIIVWHNGMSSDEDPGGDGIRGRFVSPGGVPSGAEFQINSHTDGLQTLPEVTVLENGNFVVTWMSLDNEKTLTPYNIRARVFDSEGNPLADDFIVNDDAVGFNGSPQITGLEGGGFSVTWYHRADDGDNRTPDTLTYETVEFSNEGQQLAPDDLRGSAAIDAGPDGQTISVWKATHHAGVVGQAYFARILNEDGTEAVSEFRLGQAAGNNLSAPSVTWMDDGRFVLAITAGIGRQADIRIQVFNPDGSANSRVFVIDDPTHSHVGAPEIDSLGDGRFLVTWSGYYNDHPDYPRTDIVTQVIDINGGISDASYTDEDSPVTIDVADLLANDSDPDGDELIFSLLDTTSEYGANISYDADTGLLSYDSTMADDIQALGQGQSLEDSFTYSVSDGNGGTDQATVTIVVGGNGDTDAIANDDHFGPGGAADSSLTTGDRFQVADPDAGISNRPVVAQNDDGDFVTVWRSWGFREATQDMGFILQARMSDATGQHSSDIFLVSEDDSDDVQVTMLQSGGFLVTWTGHWETPDDPIYDERYGLTARVFSADGTPASEKFALSDVDSSMVTSAASLTELSNGNIAVARYSYERGSNTTKSMELVIFTQEGQQVGTPISIEGQFFDRPTDFDRLNDMTLKALSDGGFLATWSTIDAAIDPENPVIKTAIYGNNGQVIQPETTVSVSHDQHNWVQDSAVHEDGSYVVVWASSKEAAPEEIDLRASVFNADGSVAAEEFAIGTGISQVTGALHSDVTFLPNGQIAVTWKGVNAGGGAADTEIFVQVFNQDGSAATDQVDVTGDAWSGDDVTPSIVLLDGDSFAVTWLVAPHNDFDDWTFEGQVFDFNGEEVETSFAFEDDVTSFDVTELLENDSLGSDELIFALSSDTSANGATLSYDVDTGLITYDPTAAADIQALNNGQILEDAFVYSLSDDHGGTDQAIVTIVIGGQDDFLG
jgi:Ca2+-binding RTX toxin-like protein